MSTDLLMRTLHLRHSKTTSTATVWYMKNRTTPTYPEGQSSHPSGTQGHFITEGVLLSHYEASYNMASTYGMSMYISSGKPERDGIQVETRLDGRATMSAPCSR